jgi:ribosomal protein L12E/L44/L45/RPP1/RPP2
MAGTKRHSPTATLVSKAAISQASLTLMDLPDKPKEIWSLREAINALQDQIILTLDRGYDYSEISTMLTQQGVEIRPSTLKYYLSGVRRGKNGKRRVVGKLTETTLTNANAAVDAIANAAVDAMDEPDDAKKPRGRKSKTGTESSASESSASKVSKTDKIPTKSGSKTTTKSPATRGRRKATSV